MTRLQCYLLIIQNSIFKSDSSLEDFFFLYSEKYLLTPTNFFLIVLNHHSLKCGGSTYKNKGHVSLWPLYQDWKSGRINELEIPRHRGVSMALLIWAILLAWRIWHKGMDNVENGSSALCLGEALISHLSAEVGPRASYEHVFGLFSSVWAFLLSSQTLPVTCSIAGFPSPDASHDMASRHSHVSWERGLEGLPGDTNHKNNQQSL